MGTDSYQRWYNRHTLLASVGAVFEYRDDYKEGDIVTADCRGITLRFPYTEVGTKPCITQITKEQLSEVMCKHAEKEKGVNALLEIMLESLMVAERGTKGFQA